MPKDCFLDLTSPLQLALGFSDWYFQIKPDFGCRAYTDSISIAQTTRSGEWKGLVELSHGCSKMRVTCEAVGHAQFVMG